jgi:hypothetical protein
VALALREGRLHRLDLQVNAVGVFGRHPFEPELRQDRERQQRREPLSVGGELVDGDVAVRDVEGIDPAGTMRGEVFERHRAALRLGLSDDTTRQPPLVKRAAPGRGDLRQRVARVGERHPFPRLGRAPSGQKHPRELCEAAEAARSFGPLRGDPRGHRKAVARVSDGRREERFERHRAEATRERDPPADGPRDGHRVPPELGNRGASGEPRKGPRTGRPARRIEAVQALSIPDQGEEVSPDPVHRGLDHRERRRRRDGGVDRVAPLLEDPQGRLRREPVGGGDDVPAHHGGPLRGVGQVEPERRPFHVSERHCHEREAGVPK